MSAYKIDPKVIPTCLCMATQISLGLVLLLLKNTSVCLSSLQVADKTLSWKSSQKWAACFKLQQITLEHLCQLYDTVSPMSFLITNPGLISISMIPEVLLKKRTKRLGDAPGCSCWEVVPGPESSTVTSAAEEQPDCVYIILQQPWATARLFQWPMISVFTEHHLCTCFCLFVHAKFAQRHS